MKKKTVMNLSNSTAKRCMKTPKKCDQEKCSMFTKVLFSRCALDKECFQECRKSGYKKHFEEVK